MKRNVKEGETSVVNRMKEPYDDDDADQHKILSIGLCCCLDILKEHIIFLPIS